MDLIGLGLNGLRMTEAAGQARADASIIVDMQNRALEHDERLAGVDRSVPDVVRHPRPAEKPRPGAQWDEAAGRWEVWSEAEGGWVSLEDGSVQAPCTRSVEPNEDGVTRPPPLDLR